MNREDSNRVLLYLAVDGPQNAWTRRSLKQADLILFVADAMDENSSRIVGEYELLVKQLRLAGRCELVLVHDDVRQKDLRCAELVVFEAMDRQSSTCLFERAT